MLHEMRRDCDVIMTIMADIRAGGNLLTRAVS